MTAVTDLIDNLRAYTRTNDGVAPMICDVDLMVAALLELAGGGGGGSPGGAVNDVQRNDGVGGFAGSDALRFDGSTLFVDGSAGNQVSISNPLAIGSTFIIDMDGAGNNSISNTGAGLLLIATGGVFEFQASDFVFGAATSFQVTAATQADIIGGASLISFGTDVNIGSNGSINLTSDTGIISLDGANGVFCFRQFAAGDGILGLSAVDLASLPVPNAGQAFSVITDALTPVAGAVAVGGGAVIAPVYYDGTDWRILVVPV